jgi:HEAT repeat protein
MQSAPAGFAGNSISREDLISEISQFLREREVDKPRQVAEKLIEQLRTRNFILCYVGADIYTFMHRTFLEYFCASYFVEQFEKRRKLSLEDLIETVYRPHWQDATWHEVLRLIVAQIDSELAGKIIEWLIEQEDPAQECTNIFLAAECLLDVKERYQLVVLEEKLIYILKEIAVDYELDYYYDEENSDSESEMVNEIKSEAIHLLRRLRPQQQRELYHLDYLFSSGVDRDIQISIVNGVACGWDDQSVLNFSRTYGESIDRDFVMSFMIRWQIKWNFIEDEMLFYFFQNMLDESINEELSCLAVHQLATKWNQDPTILPLIKDIAKSDSRETVRSAALSAIAKEYQKDSNTWYLITSIARSDPHESVRSNAVETIAQEWSGDLTAFSLIMDIARSDLHKSVQCAAVKAIEKGWPNTNDSASIIEIAKFDPHPEVRCAAVDVLSKLGHQDNLIFEIARTDLEKSVRQAAIWAIANQCQSNLKSLPVLIEISRSDTDFYTRGSTIWAIAQGWRDRVDILEFIIKVIKSDAHEDVRTHAVSAISNYWRNEPQIFPLLVDLAQNEPNEFVRGSAVEAIHDNMFDRADILSLFISLARLDPSQIVRFWAIRGIIESDSQEPDILQLLIDRTRFDVDDDIRAIALKEISKGYRDYEGRFELLCDRAMNDPFIKQDEDETNPRFVALFALARQYQTRSETLEILRDRAMNDLDPGIREFATEELK